MEQTHKGWQRLRRPARLVGLASIIAICLSLIYVALGPGFSLRAWSDALCASAMVLGVISAMPVVFDAGRGLAMPLTLASRDRDSNAEAGTSVLQREHSKREKGMTVTFSLAFAAVLVGIISLVVSLWP